MARAIGLIGIPVLIYVASFVGHFAVLNHTGTGDANMSSIFQAGLVGSELSSNPIGNQTLPAFVF